MQIAFTKMEGLGNDFVVIDEREAMRALSPPRVVALADRRRGIGFDQLVRLRPCPPGREADLLMLLHNSDGSEASACGNAARCVAALTGARRIATRAGVVEAACLPDGEVSVDMGPPRLDGASLGLTRPLDDTLHLPLEGDPAGCAMGNPHATVFTDQLDDAHVSAAGQALEHDRLFADRANIGFARVDAPDRIRLRVWERGAGLTLACGTGACAALVNAHRRGLAARRATLVLDGGTLLIEWQPHGHVLMTGPARVAFTGSFTP